MNSGRPVWHGSIAFLNKNGPIAFIRWGDGTLREARRRLDQMLNGVGQGPTIYSAKEISLQARRSLSDVEIGRLSAEWLAIPARDEFSQEGEIEMAL